jgi:hypothetical protein
MASGSVLVRVSNADLLAWFADDEGALCGYCGERASVTLPDAQASSVLRAAP